ncbi:MAG: mechanosensitive ion channel, partial [Bacteroidetes bacterium]|nr:mechanosensitive ion channel [Bacteroidota bacterium]
VMILLFKPFKVGDYVSVGESNGQVHEIQILNTQLITEKGEAIIIPNRKLTNEVIVNYSNLAIIRMELEITMTRSNYHKENVEQRCLNILSQLSGVSAEPKPEFLIVFSNEIEQIVTFQFSFDVERKQRDQVKSMWWKLWMSDKV